MLVLERRPARAEVFLLEGCHEFLCGGRLQVAHLLGKIVRGGDIADEAVDCSYAVLFTVEPVVDMAE